MTMMNNLGALVNSIPAPRISISVLAMGYMLFTAASCALTGQSSSASPQTRFQRVPTTRNEKTVKRENELKRRFGEGGYEPGADILASCMVANVTVRGDYNYDDNQGVSKCLGHHNYNGNFR